MNYAVSYIKPNHLYFYFHGPAQQVNFQLHFAELSVVSFGFWTTM